MLGAIAQFERNLLLERQRESIAIAKSKGKYKGKQSRFSDADIQAMKELFSVPGTHRVSVSSLSTTDCLAFYRLVVKQAKSSSTIYCF